ncbi:MAG: hypothetical protein ABJA50_03215 [Chloroflexota bacterium]
MPEYLDIYALTKHREAETIKRFLEEYVDRGAHEDMGDEEIMMLPLGRQGSGSKYLLPEVHERAMSDAAEYRRQYQEPEWEDAVSLENVVRRGLDYPRRSFTVYLQPRESGLEHVILSFTADDLLVLGVAVDAEREEGRARAILRKIMLEYDCELVMIAAEEAPPCSEEEFRTLGSREHNIYFEGG